MPELKSKSEEQMIEMQDLNSEGKAIEKKTEAASEEESETTSETPAEEAPKKKSRWSRLKRSIGKVFSGQKNVDDMDEDEFRVHLAEVELNGEAGYESNYDKLVEELKTMPSIMALAKKAETKDIAEAIGESDNADSEDKASSKEAAKEPEKEEKKEAAAEAESKKKSPTVAKGAIRKAQRKEENAEQEDKTEEEKEAEEEVGKDAVKEEAAKAKKKTKNVEKKVETGETNKKAAEEEKEEEEEEKEEAEEEGKENGEGEGEKGEEGEKKEDAADDEKAKKEEKEKQMKELQSSAINLGSKGFSSIGDIMRTRSLSKAAKNADSGTAKGRRLQYASYDAKKKMSSGLFGFGQGALDVINKVFDIFGNDTSKKIAKLVTGFVSKGLDFGKGYFERKIDKKASKNGLKGILGGSDVYKKLKAKYKLHAPDMRRAIRTAAGHSSVSDLINADRDSVKKYDTSLTAKNEITDEEEKKKLKKQA
ncbi:MAG: hypothetical protein K6G84_07230 [Lachnospiraceae bacterium]|nr:hypothetical protein [Lachnospiraceae bacterium]